MERISTCHGGSQLFFTSVIKFLEEHKEEIADKASMRIYRELDSYRNGDMPVEESRQTLLQLMDFMITCLQSDEVPMESPFMKNVIQFEEGIAYRRIRYRIKLVDLLHGMRIFRNEIWRALEGEFWKKADSRELFLLEGKLNKFFVNHLISVSGYYMRSQEEIIESHENALRKWEDIMSSASRIDLKIPCHSEFALAARAQAEALARRAGFDGDEVQDIKAAVGEAVDNAIEHGYSDKGIQIHYNIDEREFRVVIVDFGKGFDPVGIGEEMPDLLAERGRGIFLMKNLVDKVEIISGEGQGTTVVLSNFRHPETVKQVVA
ncbi:MAG: ATP-binding protein [Candidatus Eremiobacteraeota bacterium]|nr:ATP-binding protein [Candidatus Eremiobacteraeota bacterium]